MSNSQYPKPSSKNIQAGFSLVLKGLGITTNIEQTAQQTTQAWLEHLTTALHHPPPAISLISASPNRGIIQLNRIPFHSLCSHHLLPFFGYAKVEYIPDKHICSISSLSKITQHLAKQPTLQEQLTLQISQHLQQVLQPKALKINLSARHLCLQLRNGHPHTFSTSHTQGQW